jgi:hypothetical protein
MRRWYIGMEMGRVALELTCRAELRRNRRPGSPFSPSRERRLGSVAP